MKKEQNSHKNKNYHRISFVMNDEEFQLTERYCQKYKIKNKTKLMKEAIIRTLMKQLDEDRPTLFDQEL